MLRHRTRTAVLATLGLATALSLTACGGGDDTASSTTDKPAATSPSASASASNPAQGDGGSQAGGNDSGNGSGTGGTGGSATASPATGGKGTGTGTGTTAACTTANLEISAIDNSYKQEGTVTVQFINRGATCHIHGFPGADLKTNAGTVSIPRNKDKAQSYDLIKGAVAAFNITFRVNDTGGSGVRPTQIVVTPPNETHSKTVAWPAGSLPVTDGSEGSGSLTVSPVQEVM
ncbi:DUF4232 domain-containing protein [Streptomyces sp. NPDC052225]|uniref:DUF4232 domain-containing protein n=1 Tax=Streptomyces sp. NPDC052225 TaxID=3154949 RepID=UPI00342A02BB